MEKSLLISSRQTTILYKIIKAHPPISLHEIADDLQISLRTVQRELAQLKPLLKRYNLKLVKKIRAGVYINGDLQKKTELLTDLGHSGQMKEFSPRERRIGLTCDLLRLNEPTKLYVFSKRYNVTEATISHDLDEVEHWLMQFDLELIRKPGLGIYVTGGEKQIRTAIATIVHDHTLPENWIEVFQLLESDEINEGGIKEYIPEIYFELIDFQTLSKVQKVLQKHLHQKDSINLTERDFINLVIHIVLAVERNKHSVMIDNSERYLIKKEYPLVFYLVKELESEMGVRFPSNEIQYIILHIYGIHTPLQTESEYDEVTISHFVYSFISETERFLQKRFLDSSLVEGLTKHLYPALNRLKNGLTIYNPLLGQIKKDYPEVYKACSESAKTLSEKIGVAIPESEIGYLALHIGASYYEKREEKRICQAIIVCASGFGTSRLIASRIKKELPNVEIVDIVASSDLKSWLHQYGEVDLIISTVKLINVNEDKLSLVSPLLTEYEIGRLNEKIKHMMSEENELPKDHTTKEIDQNLLLSLAKYGEAILQILRSIHVHESKIEDGDFLGQLQCLFQDMLSVHDSNRVIEDLKVREKQGSFIIDGIMILHARTSGVNEMIVKVIRLSEQKCWKDDNGESQTVHTVLIMLGPKEASKEYFTMIGEISSALIESDFIKKMREDSSEELKTYLQGILLKAYKQKILSVQR